MNVLNVDHPMVVGASQKCTKGIMSLSFGTHQLTDSLPIESLLVALAVFPCSPPENISAELHFFLIVFFPAGDC